MKFACAVFLIAFVVAASSIETAAKNFGGPRYRNTSIKLKRSVGVSRDVKREYEINKKDGSSVKITKSISYNDGGALQMLPAAMDSAGNNRIRVLNQIQNGKGRPELANSMINAAGTGAGVGSADDFGIENTAGTDESNRFINWGNIGHHSNSTTTTESIVPVETEPPVINTPAPSRPVIVVEPPTSRPVVIHPVTPGPFHTNPSRPVCSNNGFCCMPSSKGCLPIMNKPGRSSFDRFHEKMQRQVEHSIKRHGQIIIEKQALLDELIAKHQSTQAIDVFPGLQADCDQQTHVVVGDPAKYAQIQKDIDFHSQKLIKRKAFEKKLADIRERARSLDIVLAPHVHTPDCGHQQTQVVAVVPVQHVQVTPVVVAPSHQSRHEGLKELIAYKKAMKVERHRNKLAAYYTHKAQKYGGVKCPTCNEG